MSFLPTFFRRSVLTFGLGLLATAAAVMPPAPVQAKERVIGTVDTVFKMFTRDDDIIVEAYDDPDVEGITCYVSRARTGGIKGSLGVAEDKSEVSISCH